MGNNPCRGCPGCPGWLDVLWMSGCPQCGCPGCPGCLGCHLKVFAPPNPGNGIIFKSIKIKNINVEH